MVAAHTAFRVKLPSSISVVHCLLISAGHHRWSQQASVVTINNKHAPGPLQDQTLAIQPRGQGPRRPQPLLTPLRTVLSMIIQHNLCTLRQNTCISRHIQGKLKQKLHLNRRSMNMQISWSRSTSKCLLKTLASLRMLLEIFRLYHVQGSIEGFPMPR